MLSTLREVITAAVQIADEYDGNLSVRQLYYQFVSRRYLPNAEESYRKVVRALTKARLEGTFPWDWIQDRTRTAKQSDQFTNWDNMSTAMARSSETIRDLPEIFLKRSRWWAQETYVTVGVEKEALSGVFEEPCDDLGVGLFVFRGYASLSSLYQLAQHLAKARDDGARQAVVLYFGDHDPDGWEIPRSAENRVWEIARSAGLWLPVEGVEWERVALNMDQIEQYDPPPFPAKTTSSRFRKYFEEHDTDDAWELDALRPDVLQDLIRDSVEQHFEEDVFEENEEQIEALRDAMRQSMQEPDWMSKVWSK